MSKLATPYIFLLAMIFSLKSFAIISSAQTLTPLNHEKEFKIGAMFSGVQTDVYRGSSYWDAANSLHVSYGIGLSELSSFTTDVSYSEFNNSNTVLYKGLSLINLSYNKFVDFESSSLFLSGSVKLGAEKASEHNGLSAKIGYLKQGQIFTYGGFFELSQASYTFETINLYCTYGSSTDNTCQLKRMSPSKRFGEKGVITGFMELSSWYNLNIAYSFWTKNEYYNGYSAQPTDITNQTRYLHYGISASARIPIETSTELIPELHYFTTLEGAYDQIKTKQYFASATLRYVF